MLVVQRPRGYSSPVIQALLTTCVVTSWLAALGALACGVYALSSSHSGWRERVGLLISVLAAAPSLLFAISGIYRANRELIMPWHPHAQTLLDLAIVWLLVGPFLFLASASLSNKRVTSRVGNGFRSALLIGWIAASSVVVEACVYT
jgi:hypothetical protein